MNGIEKFGSHDLPETGSELSGTLHHIRERLERAIEAALASGNPAIIAAAHCGIDRLDQVDGDWDAEIGTPTEDDADFGPIDTAPSPLDDDCEPSLGWTASVKQLGDAWYGPREIPDDCEGPDADIEPSLGWTGSEAAWSCHFGRRFYSEVFRRVVTAVADAEGEEDDGFEGICEDFCPGDEPVPYVPSPPGWKPGEWPSLAAAEHG